MSSTASRSFDTKQNSGSNQNSDSGQNSGGQNSGGQNSGGQNISKNAAANAGANEVSEIREDFQTLLGDVGSSVSTFCKNRPQMAALMIFTLGFYVGWKIKPW
jgi:hypothetical protein